MRAAIVLLLSLPSVTFAQGGATSLASESLGGQPVGAFSVALSPDGRQVAFASYSDQLVAGDVNAGWDVFVRDRTTGAIEIVSRSEAGSQGHPYSSPWFEERGVALACSRDARIVAFTSSAPDLVTADGNTLVDVFARDRVLGTTTLASIGLGGLPANGHSAFVTTSSGQAGIAQRSYAPSIGISEDGRFLAFTSAASNLVPGDTNQRLDVFVRDLQNGLTERVSVNDAGTQSAGGGYCASISADGRYVAFQSSANDLVPSDTNNRADVFVRDRLMSTTTRVSVSSSGIEGDHHSGWYVWYYPPSICAHCPIFVVEFNSTISADGRFVAFTSYASTLDPTVGTLGTRVYLHDRLDGSTRLAISTPYNLAWNPSLSADGRYLALLTSASDMGPADVNAGVDVYRLDRLLGRATIESVDASGAGRRGTATAVALAADGHQVAFLSSANLVAGGGTLAQQNAWSRNAPVLSFVADCEGTPGTCPCGNLGQPGHGCANSIAPEGARLAASGVPSVGADTLALTASGLPGSAPVLFLQSASSVSSASAPGFGDGVLCLAGTLLRLAARSAHSGVVQLGGLGDPRLSQLGGIPSLGTTVRYQVVYRNAAAYCTADAFNTSNSIAVPWGL